MGAVGLPRPVALLRSLAVAFAAGLLLAAGSASAQYVEEPAARMLTGVLKRIKAAGTVRLGYRQDAVPFSYEGPGGRPYGYSIDLCQEITGRQVNWSYSESNRTGDHIWWVSDVRKFRRDYPGWDFSRGIRDILEELYHELRSQL